VGLRPDDFTASPAAIISQMVNFLRTTQGEIAVWGFASYEKNNYPKDPRLSELRAETLQRLLHDIIASSSIQPPLQARSISHTTGYSNKAAEKYSDRRVMAISGR